MCIPIVPSAAGSLPASSPCRKAIERRFEKTDYCARECQGPSSPLVPASVVVGPFSRAVPGNGAAGAARCSSARRTSGRRADESPPSKRRPTFAGARPGGPLGTLRLARASSAHDAPLPVGGSEGARPPASLRRGTAKRGPKEYTGSPALAASDEPVRRARERAGSTSRIGVLHALARPRPARVPDIDAAGLVRSPDAGHGLPGGQALARSACMPRCNIPGARVHDPLGSVAQPAEGLQRLLASHRVSDRPPAPGVCAVTARKAVIGVASGPEPRHARRYLPRHDLHGMKANMESASHVSVWDVGYLPPCAVAATCGIGVRPPAASRVSMSVPSPEHPAVQAVQGLRRESRRGR